MTIPHCGDLALYFGPDIVNGGLNRDSHDPSHIIIYKIDKETDVKPAVGFVRDATRLSAIVSRSERTNGSLAD